MANRINRPHNFSAAIGWVMLWVLMQLCLLAERARSQVLHTDKEVYAAARLVGITEDLWQFELGEEQIQVGQDLLRWGAYPGIIRSQAIWTSDGSWLCGELEMETEKVAVISDWFESFSLPFSKVRGMVLNSPATLEQWLELESQLLETSGTEDHVWLRDGNRLSGVLNLTKESLASQSVVLETGGQEITLSLEQIVAVVFSPALQGPLSPRSTSERIGIRDGSMIIATRKRIDDQRVVIESADGLQLASFDVPSEFAKAISSLEHTPPNVVRLSDLEPASFKHLADNTLQWQLGINRDVYARPLIVDSGVVANGLALHSASQVAYRWDGSPARLIAEIRFAKPQAGGSQRLGSVMCRLLVAREGELQTIAEIPLKRSAANVPDSAMPNIDVSGAQLIVLIVEPADYGQYGDHVLWLDARLYREPE